MSFNVNIGNLCGNKDCLEYCSETASVAQDYLKWAVRLNKENKELKEKLEKIFQKFEKNNNLNEIDLYFDDLTETQINNKVDLDEGLDSEVVFLFDDINKQKKPFEELVLDSYSEIPMKNDQGVQCDGGNVNLIPKYNPLYTKINNMNINNTKIPGLKKIDNKIGFENLSESCLENKSKSIEKRYEYITDSKNKIKCKSDDLVKLADDIESKIKKINLINLRFFGDN